MADADKVPAASNADWFAFNVAFPAEGWRTAHLTCLICGATITLSRTHDTAAMHKAWHEQRGEVPNG